jgi:hypothetical protein
MKVATVVTIDKRKKKKHLKKRMWATPTARRQEDRQLIRVRSKQINHVLLRTEMDPKPTLLRSRVQFPANPSDLKANPEQVFKAK